MASHAADRDRDAPARADIKKLVFVIRQRELIGELAPDDPFRRRIAPVVALLDQAQTCALVNRTLGTSVTPWELASWPMEFVQTVIGWAQPETLDAGAGDDD